MARDMTKMVERLNDLIAVDMDAVQAYRTAIDRIDVPALRDQLRAFQQDHERHIRDLTTAVKGLGGKPRERMDVKGFLMQGFTAITAQMGDEAALKAMQANEKLTSSSYRKASEEEWPADVKALISRNLGDEQRHLNHIEKALQTRAWEHAAPAGR